MASPVSTESPEPSVALSAIGAEYEHLNGLRAREASPGHELEKEGWFDDGTAFSSQEDLLAALEAMVDPIDLKKSRRLVGRHERLQSTSSKRRKWTRIGLLSLLFVMGLAITARVVPATIALETRAHNSTPASGQVHRASHSSPAPSANSVVAPAPASGTAGSVGQSPSTTGAIPAIPTTALAGSATARTSPPAVPTPVPTPAPPSNLFSNPSFETDTSGWTSSGSITRSGAVAPPPGGGAYEALVAGTSSHPSPVQISSVPIELVNAGQRYTASGFFDMDGYISADITLSITEYTAAGAVVDQSSSKVLLSHTTSWQQATVSYTVERSGGYIVVSATNGDIYDAFLADMFSLKLVS